jgi:quinoprotein glucose dehydrogenase
MTATMELSRARIVLFTFIAILSPSLFAQHRLSPVATTNEFIAPASNQGELAIKRFQVAPGLKVDLWAAEPMLANPVAFNFDEKGRAYVCETFRLGAGVDDIRQIMDWLDEELAARTVDDRLAEMKRHLGERFNSYTNHSERIQFIEDTNGDGKADRSTIFAEQFNTSLDGIGAGILARKGNVWYANIPNLWLLRDTNNDGVADIQESLHYGFGVRVGFLGHDLHGVHFGPDGKIYFSIGDRGSNIKLADGRNVGYPDAGCVFRCNPDGSELEIFAFGLRNPQDLVFNQYGDLFTGDNNSDSGDQARWVYVVEGGDSGWRVGYQFMENPYSRGPFNAEKLWYPAFEHQAAYIVPPIANIASGPSGVAYFPGTGLPAQYKDHYFLVDFRGGATDSGVHMFKLRPKGASFELIDREHFLWGILATDIKFGPQGGAYVSDWVEGWGMTGKGRLYRVHDSELDKDALTLETKELLAQGMGKRSAGELAKLLAHADMRVRQEAQFELAERGIESVDTLIEVARKNSNQLARIHAIWGMGQILSRFHFVNGPEAGLPTTPQVEPVYRCTDVLTALLTDRDPEIRAQSAKVTGEQHSIAAYDGLIKLLTDSFPRVRFFAATSLGKLGKREAIPAILSMLRENADKDPYVRHAGAMALTWIGDVDALIDAGKDESSSVRMGALLAMRRLQRDEIAMFLHDRDPFVVLEAARAINDEPINGAAQDLAALITNPPNFPSAAATNAPDNSPSGRTSLVGGQEEALLRRVLNANFHVGTTQTAKALAGYAARKDAPDNMRAEALEQLADWEHPSGRDRVVGLWRPVAATRYRGTAVQSLEPILSDLLRTAPESVTIAAIRAAKQLEITNVAPVLSGLVTSSNLDAKVRIEALRALSILDSATFEKALNVAQSDPNEEVRKAATELQALATRSDAAEKLAATLEKGTTGEKQAALAALGALKTPAAENVLEKWLDRLTAGEVPKELQLDLLEAAGKHPSPAIKQRVSKYEASKPKEDVLVSYEEALFGGNAEAGKKIFLERADVQCLRCHKINGQGGDVGPDLSHIGTQKDRRYLLESIVFPNRQIAQGYESVMVTLKNDDSFAGVFKSENADELVINTPQSGLVTIKKKDIETRQKSLSPMPEGMAQILSKRDLRDLIAYLSSLK